MKVAAILISLLVGCGTTSQSYTYLFRPVGPLNQASNLGPVPTETSGSVEAPSITKDTKPGPIFALVTPEHAQQRPANELRYRLDLRHRLGYKIKQTCFKNEKCRQTLQCYYNNNFRWCP